MVLFVFAEFIVRFKSTCVGAEVHDTLYLQNSGMWPVSIFSKLIISIVTLHCKLNVQLLLGRAVVT